jgi:hypothetical protein
VLRAVASATARNRPPVAGLWEVTRVLREVVTQVVEAHQWPAVERMSR